MAARSTAAIVLLALVSFAGPSSSHRGVMDPAAAAAVDWARGRFVAAGLDFPEVDVVAHDDLFDCGGHVGLYHPGRRLLELCRADSESVLHELAHAWADFNLSDADRAAFTAYRGVAGWNDQSEEWRDRATEHVAEIMVWALMDRDTTVKWVEDGVAEWRLLTIPDSSPERLAAGFEMLTGRAAPTGRCIVARCTAPVAEADYPAGR